MLEPLLFENIVANWLLTAAKDLILSRRKGRWPDFELRASDGTRILIELKSTAPSRVGLTHLSFMLRTLNDSSAHFFLVTPTAPNSAELAFFARLFKERKGKARWLTIQELPHALGKPSPGPWDSPKTWEKLQNNALTEGLQEYEEAPKGPSPDTSKKPGNELEALARQFPFAVIGRLNAKPGTWGDKLGLGKPWTATIVLSDMVNFSSLVTASRPDDLKEAMTQYYMKAREAVFEYDGMLDKFIGDAVLAVFGYPEPDPAAGVKAIQFAMALIQIGKVVTDSWKAELNAEISTGTRIGIATGDIWPISIGTSFVEISLLGDTINLASRLEKHSQPDRFTIDNRTHTAVRRNNASFTDDLGLQKVEISPENAKGQAFTIKAWTQPLSK